jgi:general secretion pathway protein A
MFESQFGLSGPPFQLSPDPAFYFDSRGHSHALAYLKFGIYQGEGFIVVTGEVGAGKTTLVHTLLDRLNGKQIVAAQVVSTQLESGDLLQAICTAFGIPTQGSSKAQLLGSLEGFLTALAARGQRGLLVIDEAQNLGLKAMEELRMLSNFQLGSRALLQSFLVGQPELRRMLHSPSMEQLRQRVIASCHLGPLSADETRAYIEHRLGLVGWDRTPRFDQSAFEQIHACTDGIPRRINLLCNRLMLAAYLQSRDAIDGKLVNETAQELRAEVGDPVAPVKSAPGLSKVDDISAA